MLKSDQRFDCGFTFDALLLPPHWIMIRGQVYDVNNM